MEQTLTTEVIATKILIVRGKKRVMLDRDLAELYGVETGRLNEQVKRNKERFPEDFMFQLTWEEAENLISHFAISSWGGVRKPPFVFTQEGVAMLSGVLNSPRAIKVNVQIMRAFVKLRRMLLTNTGLRRKIEAMEKKYDKQFAIVFDAIKQLLETPAETKRKIGFHT